MRMCACVKGMALWLICFSALLTVLHSSDPESSESSPSKSSSRVFIGGNSYAPVDPHYMGHPSGYSPLDNYPQLPGGKYYPLYSNRPPSGQGLNLPQLTPLCAQNNTRIFCTEDPQYPSYEILESYGKYREQLRHFFIDVINLDTTKSIDTVTQQKDEVFICPTIVQYIRPLRAKDINGKWRIIVNVDGYVQAIRVEACSSPGEACPSLAACQSSRCVQKYVYQRMLVYETYDHYQDPFIIANFKIPTSCSCLMS